MKMHALTLDKRMPLGVVVTTFHVPDRGRIVLFEDGLLNVCDERGIVREVLHTVSGVIPESTPSAMFSEEFRTAIDWAVAS